jgi:DNA-binding transcriptional LysR family regulator
MQPSDLTLQQLRVLVAVVDSGSFTGAAKALRMTQPGVSHTVSGLEAALGVALLERDRSGARTTEVGAEVLFHAREVLGLVEHIGLAASGTKALEHGTLRVGSFPSAAGRLLPALVGAFGRRYPSVVVILSEGTDQEVHEWIRSREVEVGFVTLPVEGLETVSVAEDEMLAVVPEGHPLAQEGAVSVERLAAEPFVMSKGGCEPLISAAFRQAGLVPDVRFEVRETGTILAMVGEGLGVSVLPELALPGTTDGLRGTRALSLDPPVRRRLALAVRSLESASPAAAAFVEQARSLPVDRGVASLVR